MTNVQQQNIALFAVDILNISNHNEMLFNGKSFFGIHLIAIKAVFPLNQYVLARDVRICESDLQRHNITTGEKAPVEAYSKPMTLTFQRTSNYLYVLCIGFSITYSHRRKERHIRTYDTHVKVWKI